MLKKTIAALFLLVFGINANAQTASVNNIKRLNGAGATAIIESGEVKGYYSFFYLEKENRKENNYSLQIMDNNFKVLYNVPLTLSKNYRLLESSYNGERFCFSFVDLKEKKMDYKLFDKQGKSVGSYQVTDMSNSEIQMMAMKVQSDDDVYSGGLQAIPGKGFVAYGVEKEGGYRIVLDMFDNAGKKLWTAGSGATTKKSFESAYPVFANEKVVASLISTTESRMGKDPKMFCSFMDVATGKEIFRTKTETPKAEFLPVGVSYDKLNDEYFVYGEYFKPGDNQMKDKSLGFFFNIFDSKGTLKKESFADWTKDIGKVIPVNSKGKFADNMSVAIHNMVRTSDGKIYAIGEQYKKAIAAGAAALNVLSMATGGGGSGASSVKIELHDMMVFEFDANFQITGATIYEKDKVNVLLPQGYGMLSTPMLGFILRMYGWFDYSYTTVNSDQTKFNAAYVNYDRDKEEGNGYVVGNIALDANKKLTIDKIKLSKKPTRYGVMPAKPGYVAVWQYFKKTKTLEFTLEKLNL